MSERDTARRPSRAPRSAPRSRIDPHLPTARRPWPKVRTEQLLHPPIETNPPASMTVPMAPRSPNRRMRPHTETPDCPSRPSSSASSASSWEATSAGSSAFLQASWPSRCPSLRAQQNSPWPAVARAGLVMGIVDIVASIALVGIVLWRLSSIGLISTLRPYGPRRCLEQRLGPTPPRETRPARSRRRQPAGASPACHRVTRSANASSSLMPASNWALMPELAGTSCRSC